MACQRQKGDSWLAELISLIPKLFVRFISWYTSAKTVLEVWVPSSIPYITWYLSFTLCTVSKSDYGLAYECTYQDQEYIIMSRNTKHAPSYIQLVAVPSSCVLLQAAHKIALSCPKYICDQVAWTLAILWHKFSVYILINYMENVT